MRWWSIVMATGPLFSNVAASAERFLGDMNDSRSTSGMPEPTPRSPLPIVWTVGHGTRTTSDLEALLLAAGVGRVIDVRRFPASRRHPQFLRERLAAELPAVGLEYDWQGEALGGRRALRIGNRHPAWKNPAFRAYAAYMETDEFRAALKSLESEASGGQPLALMCAETLWWRCHRRLIADALVFDGFEVRHLINRPPGQVHHPNPVARPDASGVLVYDRRP